LSIYYAESKQSLLRVNFFGAKDIPDAENLDLQKYSETAEMLMCKLLPDSPTTTTNRT
jgi:endoglucanase